MDNAGKVIDLKDKIREQCQYELSCSSCKFKRICIRYSDIGELIHRR